MLGASGIGADVASSNNLAIARFSRWCRHTVRVPRSADDPTVAASQLLVSRGRAQALATGAVRDYAVPPAAVDLVRA